MGFPYHNALRGLFACAVALAIALAPAAHAQNGTVEGQVVDQDAGATLPGATVVAVGTSIGVATDVDGGYELSLAPGRYTVRASFTGFVPETQEVTVVAGESVTLNFALEQDVRGLEEVVVTGALSSRSLSRSEVAVARLDADALSERVEYSDINQLVAGKIAGVNVQTSSGNVGGGIRFNIRSGGGLNGNGQPLIFVDGVRVDNNNTDGGFFTGGQDVGVLSDLNPDDIASLEVLKGPAAAALYGTDASNGVVLITTKRGDFVAAGETAFNVNYQGSVGANTQQFEYTAETAAETFDDANAVIETGDILQNTLGVSGGSNTIRYFTQFDRRDEDGIVFGNFQERTSVRGNFEAVPNQKVSVAVNGAFTFNETGVPQNDNNILGYLGNTILTPAAYAFTDSLSIRDLDTRFRTNRFVGSFDVRYNPLSALTLRGNIGADVSDQRADQSIRPDRPTGAVTTGERGIAGRESDQISFQLSAAYDYQPIEGLDLTSSLGLQGFDDRFRSTTLVVQGFDTPFITDIGAGADFIETGEFLSSSRQLGVIFDQAISYNDTYFGGIGVRRDYATAIGQDAADVFYPSIRGAVRLDRFAGVPSAFSILKLRAAYGESGQLPGLTQGVPLIFSTEVGADGVGAVPVSIGNPEIDPERIREVEFGIDAELFGRVGLEATYFIQDAEDSIFTAPLAPSTGANGLARPVNVGAIQGQGLELALNATVLQTENATVDLGTIFNYITNRVTDSNGQPFTDGFNINYIQGGFDADGDGDIDNDDNLPRSAFYLPVVTGARFDADGEYVGPQLDDQRTFLGIPYPDVFGSFTANVTLFQDLSIYGLVDYSTGLSVYNNTRRFQARFGNDQRFNEVRERLDGLTPGTDEYNEVADELARVDGGAPANFIEDGDFLKLREVSVRYNVGRFIARTPGLSNVRTASLGFSGRNLLTATGYEGVDPEVNFGGARAAFRGQDFLTLQNPRVFFATLTLGF